MLFDQTTVPVQPFAVNVVEPPAQIVVFPEIIGALGTGFIMIFVEETALSQLALSKHLKS